MKQCQLQGDISRLCKHKSANSCEPQTQAKLTRAYAIHICPKELVLKTYIDLILVTFYNYRYHLSRQNSILVSERILSFFKATLLAQRSASFQGFMYGESRIEFGFISSKVVKTVTLTVVLCVNVSKSQQISANLSKSQ